MGGLSTKLEVSSRARYFSLRVLLSLFNDSASHLHSKVIGIYGILLIFNVAAWVPFGIFRCCWVLHYLLTALGCAMRLMPIISQQSTM